MTDAARATPKKETWREALFNRRMLICVFIGFSSGLPLYLLINLLPAWLRTEGVDLKAIGLFALIGLPYTWKFLWSPLLDRYAIPWLGRRRGWMFAMHVALLLSIPALGWLRPQTDIWTIAYLAAAIAFFQPASISRSMRSAANCCPTPSLVSATRSTSTPTGSRASFPARWR
jgi:MFS family permease